MSAHMPPYVERLDVEALEIRNLLLAPMRSEVLQKVSKGRQQLLTNCLYRKGVEKRSIVTLDMITADGIIVRCDTELSL